MIEEKRTEQINIRLKPNERKKLQELAEKNKMTISTYILSLTDVKEPTKKKCADQKQLIREIQYIGNNLNQIARALNTNNDKTTVQIALKRLESLENYIYTLKGVL